MKMFFKNLAASFIGLLCALSAGIASAQSYTQITDYVVSGGPIAPAASPGGIATWTDINGNQWSVDSGNSFRQVLLNGSPWNTAIIYRPIGEAAGTSKVDVRFVCGSVTADTVWTASRVTRSGSNTTAYIGGWTQNGTVTIGKVVSGAYTQLSTKSVTACTNGLTYWTEIETVQTDATTTTLNERVFADVAGSIGTEIGTVLTITDTTAALKNVVAPNGLFYFQTSSSAASPAVKEFVSYTGDAAATAITLTGPTTGIMSVPTTFATGLNGVPSGTVTVTPSDSGAGGAFSPTTVALSLSVRQANFTYTPSVAGSPVISVANDGGLTNPSPITMTVPSTVTIAVNNAMFGWSPANWRGDTGRGGSSWRQSWNNGAWFTASWTAGSSPIAILKLPTTATGNTVSYVLNGTLTDNVAATGNLTLAPTASSVNTLTVYLRNAPQAAKWGQSASGNTVQVGGLILDAAATPGTAVTGRPWIILVGDSITDGIAANAGSDNWLNDYSYYMQQGLSQAGYDIAISACGYSGWLHTGDSTADVPGYYVISGSSGGTGGTYNDGASRWNKLDSGISLLDSASHLSAYGSTGQEPAAIIINYMVNEAINSANTSDAQASVTQAITALRKAAPNAKIIILMPIGLQYATKFNQAYVTALRSGVTAYQSANPGDAGVYLVDLGAAIAKQLYSNSAYINGDGVHPVTQGHAIAAGLFLPQVLNILQARPPAACGTSKDCAIITGTPSAGG